MVEVSRSLIEHQRQAIIPLYRQRAMDLCSSDKLVSAQLTGHSGQIEFWIDAMVEYAAIKETGRMPDEEARLGKDPHKEGAQIIDPVIDRIEQFMVTNGVPCYKPSLYLLLESIANKISSPA